MHASFQLQMPNLPCGLPSSYHTSYWWLNDELPAEFFTRMLLCFSGETPLYHAESTLHYRLAMELWSLASERPRMFCPYLTMHDRSRTWIIPICPCARHQKQPPKRPLMNTPCYKNHLVHARFPHDVDSVQHCKQQQNRKEAKIECVLSLAPSE